MRARKLATILGVLATLVCVYLLGQNLTQPGDTSKDKSELREEFGRIEVVRDEWGIPHIFSDTDEGAMYGLGYAVAKDRAFQMYFSLRIIQGRLAELIGNAERTTGPGTAIDSDRAMRLFGFHRAAIEVASGLDNDTRTLLEAYSRGVTDYITYHRDELSHMFTEFGLEPEPWSAAACVASWWHMGQFFAGDGLGDYSVYQRIKAGETLGSSVRYDDEAAVIQREDVEEDWLQRVQDFLEEYGIGPYEESPMPSPWFSHAWVVGGSNMTTGSAVLCSDPQTPVRNPSLFYEFHVSGKTFNARGIGVPGSPAILIGWNENVAWGVTALGADQADLFLLQTSPDHPGKYLFDDEWREMDVRTETIYVKHGNPQRITIKETHLGPVVTEIVPGVRQGEEVAAKRLPMCETDRETIQAAFGMMRAEDCREFSEALQKWRFPSINVVFGDSEGDIGYWTIAAIPIRSPLALAGGSAAHEGNSSAYDWRGFVPPYLLPNTVNPGRGYLHTANNRPIGSFYKIPLGASTGWAGDTVRSWRLRELLSQRQTFEPIQVLEIHYDMTNPSKRDILRLAYFIRDARKAQLSREALNALRYLEGWYQEGARSDISRRGSELANAMTITFRQSNTPLALEYGGGQSGLCLFLRETAAALDENPEIALGQDIVDLVDGVMASAWRYCQSQYGRVSDEWSDRAGDNVRGRRLGYFDSLDGFGSLEEQLDVAAPSLSCVDHGTLFSQSSQSYTQWVPLHDVDSALSILPIGQSETPNNHHRLSTLGLWEVGRLHPSPITRSAVEHHALESFSLA